MDNVLQQRLQWKVRIMRFGMSGLAAESVYAAQISLIENLVLPFIYSILAMYMLFTTDVFTKKGIALILILMSFHCYAQVKFVQPNLKKADEFLVYIGINNYFLIQNPQASKILTIKSTEGKVERLTDSTFNLFVNSASINGIQFSYSWVKNGKLQKNMVYPVTYLTATVPDVSRLRLGTKSNGKISLLELKVVSKIALDDKDFKIKLNYNIQCEITSKPIKGGGKFVIAIRNGDLQNNSDYQELLSKLSKGDRMRFDKIKVIGNNNTARALESVTFIVE